MKEVLDGVDGWVLEEFDLDEENKKKTFVYFNRMLKRRVKIERDFYWARNDRC